MNIEENELYVHDYVEEEGIKINWLEAIELYKEIKELERKER